MKKKILYLLVALLSINAYAQDETPTEQAVVKSQQIKFGSSIQYEWGGGYYYEDYGYYLHSYYSPSHAVALADYDGPNTQVFLAYEYIWTYTASRLAVAIEPKLGFSFREYMTNGFVGANWKFYWANKKNWRMGIYLYTGYEYTYRNKSMFVSMEQGMYREEKDVKLNEHVMSYDLGFIPFQFKTSGVPIIIECNVNIIGLHVFRTISSEYEVADGETTRYKYSETGAYGPRIELKIGWQFR